MSGKKHPQVRRQVPNVRFALRYHLIGFVLHRVMVVLIAIIVALGVVNAQWYHRAFAAPTVQGITSARTPAVVASSGAHLYASPGGEVYRNLPPGTVVIAIGSSSDKLWVVVQTVDNLSGWIQVNEIVVYGMEQLPVMLEISQITPVSSTEAQPTATLSMPTVAPLPSFTPSSTPQPTVVSANYPLQTGEIALVAIVLVPDTGLYDRPDGTRQEQLAVGLVLTASGRSTEGEWLFVRTPSGGMGWVQIADVVVTNAEGLPIVEGVVDDLAPSSPETSQESLPQAQLTPTPDVGVDAPSGEKGGTSPADPNQVTATVVQIDSRLNVRSGPGTAYLIVSSAEPGDTFEVNGRNFAATWIQIRTIEGKNGLAWVAAEFVSVSHPILNIPVTETNGEPTPVSTTTIGNIGCATNQIIKWDSGQAKWLCSNDLIILQAEVATLQAELAALRAEITVLKE